TRSIKNSSNEFIDVCHYYVQIAHDMCEMTRNLQHSTTLCFNHVNNNHRPIVAVQKAELHELFRKFSSFMHKLQHIVETRDFMRIDDMFNKQTLMIEYLNTIRKRHIQRAQNDDINSRNTLLYIQLLADCKQIIHYSLTCVQLHRDLVQLKM
ncbi:MAG: hypothetical protein LBR55_07270, partial [Bacteroidales bacterium]|nr:hypothetical protein [Bacteroidales bacterium]